MATPGQLIRQARLRNGLTQSRLALRAGTAQTAISRLEHDRRSPSLETLNRILLVMGERAAVVPERLEGEHDPLHLAAELRLSPAERLERAFAWAAFNAELQGAVARRRR